MQLRMKEHQLSSAQINALLVKDEICRLATISEDGFPYVIAMHFVYTNNKIYMHGLPKGQKIENIKRCSKVCFEIDEMLSYLTDGVENACDVNTEYKSVVVKGNAKIIRDTELKRYVLGKIVDKYAPQFSNKELPIAMIRGTSVIEIEMQECTGKYYK